MQASRPVLEAVDLGFAVARRALLSGLSFTIQPGLNFVRGGEGRGKSSLLKLMAGRLPAQAGVLHCHASSIFLEDLREEANDPVVARSWLDSCRHRHPEWDDAQAAVLVDNFGLAEHIDKPMFMLSTGSRRKVGLVAAAASGAALTLLDTPFSALDAASCRRLVDLLAEAAASHRRAWVLADYELPAGLAGVPLASCVDLGD